MTHKHHLLHGSFRNVAEKEGLFVWLCPECHNMVHSSLDEGIEYLHRLEWLAQVMWEYRYPERNWLETIGRNFK